MADFPTIIVSLEGVFVAAMKLSRHSDGQCVITPRFREAASRLSRRMSRWIAATPGYVNSQCPPPRARSCGMLFSTSIPHQAIRSRIKSSKH